MTKQDEEAKELSASVQAINKVTPKIIPFLMNLTKDHEAAYVAAAAMMCATTFCIHGGMSSKSVRAMFDRALGHAIASKHKKERDNKADGVIQVG